MRALLGPLLVHGALLLAGLGVLRAAGTIDGPWSRRTLEAAGLAYLVGMGSVLQICVFLLVVGVPFSLPVPLLICAILAVPLLPGLRRLRRPDWDLPTLRARLVGAWPLVTVLVALGVFAGVGLATLGNHPIGPSDYDAWNLWTRKAILLYDGRHLPLSALQSPAMGYLHPDYPLLLPLLEALHMRGAGRLDPSSVHVAFWLMQIAFVWAAAFLASSVTRRVVWLLVPAAAAVLEVPQLLSGYADVPVAFFLCLGALALGVWMESARGSDLAVAAIVLAGAAGLKNEGEVGMVIAFLVAGAVLARRRRWPELRRLAVALVGVVILALAPWRLWLAAHHLTGDLSLSRALDPGYLHDHFDRVWPSVTALHDQLAQRVTVAVFVSIALALIVLRMRSPRRAAAAGFYLGLGLLYFVSLVWAYWISPLNLQFHIGTSVSRIYVGIVFIAVAAILHLTAEDEVESVAEVGGAQAP